MKSNDFKSKNIVLGVSGGIAAYKAAYLLRMLIKAGASVQVIGTLNSLNFIGKSTWETLSGRKPLFDTFETIDSGKVGHIMLAQEVDAIVVAPATANIIAKVSCGIADDLLSTVLSAATVPVIFAPGMNSAMYENEANINNIAALSKRKNMFFVESTTGLLACGTTGKGRMAEPEKIVEKLEEVLFPSKRKGLKWLITGGATREYIDPIRFITNGSSGKTAVAIADAALKKDGDVTFIGVNVNAENKNYNKFVKVVSAAQALDAVKEFLPQTDIFIMSAAIADYTTKKEEKKIKKGTDNLKIELFRTEDILFSTKEMMKQGAVRIGFSAETENLEKNSLKKLREKKLDMVVANLITDNFSPFGSDSNSVKIITESEDKSFENISKIELGKIIVEIAETIFLRKNG